MDMRVKLAVGTALVAGVGISAALLLSKRGDDIREPITIAETAAVEEVEIPKPTQVQKEFQSMVVAGDKIPECALPKPPKSIGETALIRNSLRQVFRIMALRKWQKTGSCGCLYGDISWGDVVHAAPDFERTDRVDLQFKLSSLRAQGDQLDARRLKVCSE